MKNKLLVTTAALIASAIVAAVCLAGPEPSVSLYWYQGSDPTIAPGVCAPQWQLLVRTDVPSIYAHTGVTCTAWTLIGAGASGGVTGTGTNQHLTAWTGASSIGNNLGGSTDNGTTTTIGDALTVTGIATFNSNTGFSPATNNDASQAQFSIGNLALGTGTTTAVSGTLNNWLPTFTSGSGVVSFARVNTSAVTTITGFSPATHDGRQFYFQNVGTAAILVTNQDASSSAADRFITPSGTTVPIPVGAVMHLHYDLTTARWIVEYDSSQAFFSTGLGSAAAGFTAGYGTVELPPWQSSHYYPTPTWSAQNLTTSNTLGNGTLRCSAFPLPNAITASAMCAEVTGTGDAGSTIELAIYSDDGFGHPSALVLDAGHIAGNSATVQCITGLTTSLTAGWYWSCAVLQNETVTQPTLRVPQPFAFYGLGIDFGTSAPTAAQTNEGWAQASVTGALPNPMSSLIATNTVVRIFIKPQ